MAVSRESVVKRLVTDVIYAAETAIDRALTKTSGFHNAEKETISFSIPMVINQPLVIETLKQKYLAAGWNSIEFKVYHGDYRDDYESSTTVTLK